MALKDRLSRLGPGAPLSRQEKLERAESGQPAETQPEPGNERKGTLDDLRAKVNAILQSDVGPPVAPTQKIVSDVPLPFADAENHLGPFAQRLETQRLSAHVGRMPLSSAAEVDPEMLSLLALDPTLAQTDPRGALYFDTETTGLGGAGTVAFLIGLAWFDDEGALVMEQLLIKEPSQEAAVLARLAELVERASLLVSYNGKSFDWPLLQSRCVMNKRNELPRRPHLDLLHVARRLHKRRLERCRLVDLESQVLGWERGEDDIPGAEIAPIYGHYLRTGDEEALRPVIDHNAWDVLTMAALVGLYGEPMGQLGGEDLLGVTETLTRAKAFDRAETAAERAMEHGHAVQALELWARMNKARGDKARALADFQALNDEVDDPSVRLELAKLFEHHAKDFEQALAVIGGGTGEEAEALKKRRDRLERRSEAKKKRGAQKAKRRRLS